MQKGEVVADARYQRKLNSNHPPNWDAVTVLRKDFEVGLKQKKEWMHSENALSPTRVKPKRPGNVQLELGIDADLLAWSSFVSNYSLRIGNCGRYANRHTPATNPSPTP